MLLSLRFFHHIGFMCFGGLILHDLLNLLFSSQLLLFGHTTFGIFYFVTIPMFVLILVSGILLIVHKSYYVKKEGWLKKKFVIMLAMMFVVIFGIFPETKSIVSSSPKFPLLFMVSILFLLILLLANLSIALSHRATVD